MKPCLFCASPRPVMSYSVEWSRQSLCRKCRVRVGEVPYNRKILESPTFKAEPLSEAWFEACFYGVSEMAGMTELQVENLFGPVVAEVASSSNPKKSYQVRMKNGAWSCACAGWKFRRTCRHIDYCKENGIATPEKRDPLVDAIKDAFDLYMGPLLNFGKAGMIWKQARFDIAAMIREKCSLEPLEDSKAERLPPGATRVIILPD